MLPILQSSGFGKMRMCVQLSTRHPGVLVCLRKSYSKDPYLVSFPPQDAEVTSRNVNANVTAARWSVAVQAIVDAMASVGINIGAQGEQGVALACSMAVDLAVSNRCRTQLSESQAGRPTWPFSTKHDEFFGLVAVREWLETLALNISGDSGGAPGNSMDVDLGEPLGFADQQGQINTNSRQALLAPRLAAWVDRSVPHDANIVMESDVLLELWFRHAAAQGISNQQGWDFLIPTYECDDQTSPKSTSTFDKARLSYVAIQVKNWIKRPGATVLAAPVGPDLIAATGRYKECLELFIDLKAPETFHDYSQRTSTACGPEMVRHHILIGGSAFRVLDRSEGSAKSKVGLLFGKAVSLDTLEFDKEQAKYVRSVDKKATHQEAWNNAQAWVEVVLVGVIQEPSSDETDTSFTASKSSSSTSASSHIESVHNSISEPHVAVARLEDDLLVRNARGELLIGPDGLPMTYNTWDTCSATAYRQGLAAASFIASCDSLGLRIYCLQPLRDFEGWPKPEDPFFVLLLACSRFEEMRALGANLLLICSDNQHARTTVRDLERIGSDLAQLVQYPNRFGPVLATYRFNPDGSVKRQAKPIRIDYKALLWGAHVDMWC
uniref:Uncharacterized protein n=1 Tax=Melanopsichium pennsylvanicum 4 TaxID=1398559 RepID=A0A077QX14_9BASI|nr:uncharacterized protein BN887_02167 [Melanopsichium pennsylvanicum 4]